MSVGGTPQCALCQRRWQCSVRLRRRMPAWQRVYELFIVHWSAGEGVKDCVKQAVSAHKPPVDCRRVQRRKNDGWAWWLRRAPCSTSLHGSKLNAITTRLLLGRTNTISVDLVRFSFKQFTSAQSSAFAISAAQDCTSAAGTKYLSSAIQHICAWSCLGL